MRNSFAWKQTLESKMTEEEIERKVERFVDHVDRLYVTGTIDQAAYDGTLRDLNEWADYQYRLAAAVKVRLHTYHASAR